LRRQDVLYFLREDLDGVSATTATTATGTATSLRAALHDQVIQTLDAPDPNGDFGAFATNDLNILINILLKSDKYMA